MKRFLSLLLVMMVFAAPTEDEVYAKNVNYNSAVVNEAEIADGNLLEDKLVEAFPHLQDDILNATTIKNTAKCRSAQQDNPQIVYREGKWIDEEEYVAIAFDEDGAYSAYNLLIGEGKKTWLGGTTSSGTSYRNVYNATLRVSNSYYLHTITISPISYSIVSNGYDSFINTGIATSPIESHVTANPVRMKESSTNYAYACYNMKNVLIMEQSTQHGFPIEIRIRNNNVNVYLFGEQI